MNLIPTQEQIEQYAKLTPAGRREVNKDPYRFLLFFSYYFLEFVKFPFANFHSDMAQDWGDLVTGKIRECAWITMRDSAKTSFAKAGLVWLIANKEANYPNVDSYERDNSERFLFDVVVTLQTNRRLREDYGELFNTQGKSEEKTQKRIGDFLTTNGVRCEAHTTQESVRGRLHREHRPDFLILDDYETMVTVRSEAATRQVSDHFSEFKMGLDQKTSRILYLSNYLSDHGNVKSIMDRSTLDENLRVRTVWVVDENGKPTWPERHVLTDDELKKFPDKVSLETLKRSMRKPDSGDADYMREMMGIPFDPSTAKFHKGMFLPVTRDEVDKMETAAYLLIDPPGTAHNDASRARGEGDYVGFALVKVTLSGKWMVECWRARVGPREMVASMFAIWKTENLVAIGIEDTQFWQGMKPMVEDEEMRQGVRLDIRELKHSSKKSKAERILALLPRYESKSVWHVAGKCEDLEQELLRFPVSEHDDASDAAAMACEIAERPQGRVAQKILPKSTTVYRYNKNRLGRSGC